MLASVADAASDLAPLQAEFWLYAVRNPGTMEILAFPSRGKAGRGSEHRTAREGRAGRVEVAQ